MYLKVKVFPKSKKEEIKKLGPQRFEIKTKAKAEKNLANQRVLEMIAEYFEVETKDVRIINGHHHHSKTLKIDDAILN